MKLDFGSSVSVFYNFYSDTISLKLGKIEAFSKEEELKNVKTTAKESEEAFPTAVAGSIVLVLGAVAVKLWMKMAEKNIKKERS